MAVGRGDESGSYTDDPGGEEEEEGEGGRYEGEDEGYERERERQPAPPPREPVSSEDVQQYAAYLGIDAQAEPHLLALAHEALTAALPDGWEEVDDGEHVFFHRAADKYSQYEHPLEEQFKQIIVAYRQSAGRHRLRCCADPDGADVRRALAALAVASAPHAYELEPVDADSLVVHVRVASPALSLIHI